VTILGYIFLPIALICLFFSEKWMLRLFLFWTLFSASSAINFGSKESGSALQMWMFFAFLWLLQKCLRGIARLSLAVDWHILPQCVWIGVFLLVSCTSLIMPVYINGRLIVTSAFLDVSGDTPLYFTLHNVTQLLYLIFGCLVAVAIAHLALDARERTVIEKTLFVSAVVLALWGAFQFACNLVGIPYPHALLNNSVSPYAAGYEQTIAQGFSRVSSATLEPSYFAQCMVAALPVTFPSWLGQRFLFSPFIDRAASCLFLVMVLLSTSTTAILGLFVLALLFLFSLRKASKISFSLLVKLSAAVAAVGAAIAAALVFSPAARELATAMLIGKSQSYSAVERFLSVVLAFGYFRQYPVLGIGWGSATSHDLIVFLLANVGIVGASAFLAAIGFVIARTWKNIRAKQPLLASSSFVWFLTLTVFIVLSTAVGFPLVMGNFWVTLGVAIACGQRVIYKASGTRPRMGAA
jgi:O-antigen ligase